jgi:hypothetical protein
MVHFGSGFNRQRRARFDPSRDEDAGRALRENRDHERTVAAS